ncbi:methyltransferase domain-containing protein [Candidatus Peregrinibacteria bacterium]|nr:methyltransferase domain-containing protein [Candidatus Peregrinibacteria bacterium]MBI3816141.1 methyltransferase domain-containing protein [Candidatus Peregrinibacteria bacterium]
MEQTLPAAAPTSSAIHRNPRKTFAAHVRQLAYHVREFFYQLLRADCIRLCVAALRYWYFVGLRRRMRTFDLETGDIGVNTVHHNMLGLKKIRGLSVPRSSLLIYPLSAIRMSKSTPVLCIGPRSEGELLNLMGMGFRNVRGFDLISYSPWVDLGDMHAMSYADDQFGVVIMGWVIAYSNNRVKAAEEAVRVCRNGGIIAVGVEWSRESVEEASKRVGYQICDEKRLQSVAEILELFGDHVDRVFFSHDLPSHPVQKWQLLVLFSVKKAKELEKILS